MISGVSSYSGYAYSSTYASTQRSTASSGSCAGGPANMQEKLFSLLDSDGDGSVAKEELSSVLSAAQENDSSLSIDIDELFSQLDGNGDGSLDSDEIAALAPPPPPPPGGPNPEDMFAQLDANGDGLIDADELAALANDGAVDTSALLAELDSDGDGGLDLDELSALAPPPPPSGGPSFELAQGSEGDDATLDGLLEAVAQRPPRPELEPQVSEMIGKLLQHYQSSQNDAGSLGSQLSLSA
ncbi:XopAW family type III secretion system calcium-binding effector [Ectopseudomonas khazarica]|uniref:XopAW family type III secretion system calcium-binding effector n=1 Tax=Ectopseudomonas khazarica TaxID=2502979 RepID=UPI003709E477